MTKKLISFLCVGLVILLLDIWLEGSTLSGMELLEKFQDIYPSVPIVMISGHGTIESAVSAINLGASDFIENLPDKYETLIGENGIRLSGGQKQRISIARAFLKNSPIILLDEATSSLDAESEEKVQNAIMNLTKNKTTLVIAHRLSTIIRANKIFVLSQGRVVDIGTHNDLLKNSIIYKNLYSKQLSA